jgi:hypothetical protein
VQGGDVVGDPPGAFEADTSGGREQHEQPRRSLVAQELLADRLDAVDVGDAAGAGRAAAAAREQDAGCDGGE